MQSNEQVINIQENMLKFVTYSFNNCEALDTDVFEEYIKLELLKEDGSNLQRRYTLINLYKNGYKAIRRLNLELTEYNTKESLSEESKNFIKDLKVTNTFKVMNRIFSDEQLYIINNQDNISFVDKIRPLDMAGYVLSRSKKGLSNLELQKILYFIQLEFLHKFNKVIIDDVFEAWQFGPIIKCVYLEFRDYGANSIDRPKNPIHIHIPDIEKKALDEIIQLASTKHYWDLVGIISKEGSAWDYSYKREKRSIISIEDMKNRDKVLEK